MRLSACESPGQPARRGSGAVPRAGITCPRRRLLLELTEGERCVHDLVDALALAQPLVSQHLRILRAADLVVGTRRGREVAYSLRDEHIAHIVRDAVQHVAEPESSDGAIA